MLAARGEHRAAGRLGAAIVANGALGTYLHLRGVARKPGGLREATYNLEMGPPVFAPAARSPWSAGMGLAAALCERER